MHVYFSGIGGVGIGPLALLALDAGYEVSGSDRQASELTKLLEERGVEVSYEQSQAHIQATHRKNTIDWFVYTSALPSNHPERVFAKKQGIKISKRADFLNQLLSELNLKLVAVSGTHGKTTTTAMLVWLFQQLGIPVSYSIGTTISFGPPAQYQKTSQYFVYECDEFDRNFLEFHPHLSLITSLDYDHPDTYPSESDYFDAFSKFADQSKVTVLWQSDAQELNSQSHLFVIPDDRNFSPVELPGAHNRRNAWLAATAVNRLELVKNNVEDWDMLLQKVSTFPGTARRFEKLAENLYTDYAHHPAEITATLQLAKEVNKNVVVVYQPHQNIRQRELLGSGGYGDCFAEADTVYWLPTYLSREDGSEIVTPEELSKTASNTKIESADMNATLSQKIKDHLKAGDLVVGMSAGDLDAWLRGVASKN